MTTTMGGLDLASLERFREAMSRAPEGLTKLKEDLALRVAALMESLMRDRAPKFEGNLTQSIVGRAVVEPGRTEAVVSSDLNYAAIVDTGRKPGRMPPAEPIRRWVELKLLKRAGVEFTDEDLDGITFLIQRHIARHGTKGSRYVERAVRSAQERWIPRELTRFLERVEDLLEKGTP